MTHTINIDPQPNPPGQVFALATPDHMLHKLYWEIKQLEISLGTEHKLAFAHAPAYHAFNCAITAWHISDWSWESADVEQRALIASRLGFSLSASAKGALEIFQAALRARYRSLHLCWQIATGSKHMNIRKPDPAVKAEGGWQPQSMAGRMQAGQPLGLYLYRLSVIDDGTIREALDVFREAFKCWEDELGWWGFIEGRPVYGVTPRSIP